MFQWNPEENARDRARQMGVSFVDSSSTAPEPAAIDLVSVNICRHFHVIPIRRPDRILYLAMENPLDVDAIDAVAEATGLAVQPVLAMPGDIRVALDSYFP